MKNREGIWFYFFISPWLIGFLTLTLGPILFSIYMSLTDWDLFQKANFTGFSNYKTLFTEDEIFWKTMYNTFYYALISVPLGLALSLVIAYFLNKKLKGITFFRVLFYIPSIVPIVASSLLFIQLLAPNSGLINIGLSFLGIDGPSWLLDAEWVKPALILMSLWGIGASTVLLLAGMKGIPTDLYEAGSIDGATNRQTFFNITLPMLTPIIFFNLVTGIIAALQTFTQVYIATSGDGNDMGTPDNASLMMVPYLFINAFKFYKMGYASAVAWVLFFLILMLTLLIFKSSKSWVFYEEGNKE